MSDESKELGKAANDPSSDSKGEYVAEIMEREAELADAPPPPPIKRRSYVPILIPLLVILAGVIVWNVVRILHNPPVFTEEEEAASSLFSVYLVSQGLEAYLADADTLPTDLEAAGVDGEDVRYGRVNDTTYVLYVTFGGAEVTYHRGEDISRFASAFDVLSGEAER